ncbi:3-isopropylmalate dehydratase small subunit [Parafrankia sp. FMc2]|uniref:3-isopropylmalate dehydratase small subunit n=1 Tax=Parafrankia sp. FMc2 TaxID=3233196 RepID=UPI0034D5A8E1
MKYLQGRALPLGRDSVDTDVIAPQSELLVVDNTGLADAAFLTWRRHPDGRPTDSVLNDPRYQDARILLTGDAFGCGSSREHAVWALQGLGYEAVLAVGFGEIFERNAARNGLAPLVVSRASLDQLLDVVRDRPDEVLTIDFAAGTVSAAGTVHKAMLSADARRFIVDGHDEIYETLGILAAATSVPVATANDEPPAPSGPQNAGTALADGWQATLSMGLASWHERAGVRSTQRRLLGELDQGWTLFPRKLMPYLDHPLIAQLGPEQQKVLTARRLYDYLSFVVHLEAKVVNRGTRIVALDELGLGLPAQLRTDGWKIYCDEAYHAVSGMDLLEQVERTSGIPALRYDFTLVMETLRDAGREVGADLPGLDHLLEVIVFETVVTELLKDIPKDETVVPVIRQVVADHAADERAHHAFYTVFYDELWAKLDRRQRELVARSLPNIITACLSPDVSAVRRSLSAAGLTDSDARQVIDEAYPQERVRDDIRRSAHKTIRMFQAHDVLDFPGAAEAFESAGLLLPGDR